MPTYTDKEGKKKYHVNPQAGRAMFGSKDKPSLERTEEKLHPDTQSEGEKEHVHHVEIHHGAHPDGEPPASEGHRFHTVTHRSENDEMPEIHNHESYDEASDHGRGMMDEEMLEEKIHPGIHQEVEEAEEGEY